MTTELAKPHKPIQLYGQSLPPQQRSKHRAWIGVRVLALLDGYWQNRPSEAERTEIMGDWMAGLEAFTEDEIRAACREWLNTQPNRKPKVGNIRELVLSKRQLAVVSQPPSPEPEREVVTAEAAADIMAQAGFRPRSFGGEK